jgi:hypothetical protein
MSALTERRAAWDAAEAFRSKFFIGNTADPNQGAINAHNREKRVLLVAESIRDYGNDGQGVMKFSEPMDFNEQAEARALAEAE